MNSNLNEEQKSSIHSHSSIKLNWKGQPLDRKQSNKHLYFIGVFCVSKTYNYMKNILIVALAKIIIKWSLNFINSV